MMTLFENDDPWQDRLSEYLDGLLTESETRALDAHLHTCERCRTTLAELQAVVERLRGDQVDRVPEDAWPRIVSRLTTGQFITRVDSRLSSRARQAAMLRNIAAAMSLAFTLAGGIWIGALLCTTEPAWVLPQWMHLRLRTSPALPVLPPISLRLSPNRTDSTRGSYGPLRRSLAAIDRELAEADSALNRDPANRALRRAAAQLARDRKILQALLDSLTSIARP